MDHLSEPTGARSSGGACAVSVQGFGDRILGRALRKPLWFKPPVTTIQQNTYPWIWGDHMLYRNCTLTAQGLPRATYTRIRPVPRVDLLINLP